MGLRAQAVRPFRILAPLINVDTRAHDGDLPLIVYPSPGSSIPVDFGAPAYKRLINYTSLPHQVIPLIEAIFTSQDEVKAIGRLCGENAQTFVDVVHEVRLHTPSFPRRADCLCWAFCPLLQTRTIRLCTSPIFHHGSGRSV
jgi:hypothetical protein